MTHRLCMHQAGCGDFLSLRSPGVRILIDTGPRKYANELAAQLNRQQADLLVITHLDDDHFGGLRRLLERHPAADGPKQIWLNHFESTEALSNLIRGVEGRPIELNDHAMLEELGQSILDAAIEAGSGWASDTALEVIGADSHFDGPASVDAVVELDERAFAYVAAVAAPTLPEPWEEEDWADVEVSDEVRRLARALVFHPGTVVFASTGVVSAIRSGRGCDFGITAPSRKCSTTTHAARFLSRMAIDGSSIADRPPVGFE